MSQFSRMVEESLLKGGKEQEETERTFWKSES